MGYVSLTIAVAALAFSIFGHWYKRNTIRGQAAALKLATDALGAQARTIDLLRAENVKLAAFVVAAGGKVKAAEIVDGHEQKGSLH